MINLQAAEFVQRLVKVKSILAFRFGPELYLLVYFNPYRTQILISLKYYVFLKDCPSQQI